MRILPIFPGNWFDALIDALEPHGIEAAEAGHRPDAIVVGSISQLGRAEDAVRLWPDVPVYCYNWDLYEWSRQRGAYDYRRWERLMRMSREVWHPGPATRLRSQEWFGIGGSVIPTFIPVDHLRGAEKMIGDGGYAMMAIRESPDPRRGWFADACGDLGIPAYASDLKLPPGEFASKLARATLLVNPLREASTGGLALIEGLSLGKPSLVSASPYNDGAFYLEPFARRPETDTYADFRDELLRMWEERPTHNVEQAREFIRERYSIETMASAIAERLST